MRQSFLALSFEEQAKLLQEAEFALNISSTAIEKDFWICLILHFLFQLPEKMVFKGGTSLSKVFNLIDRFSEDVDITIDYSNFIDDLDLANKSRSQLKKLSTKLKADLKNYLETTVLPFLELKIKPLLKHKSIELVLSEDGESIRVYYPSALNIADLYLRDHVLLEFGVRNSTQPCETHSIEPILTKVKTNVALHFVQAKVEVLSPVRTFWEKATLMHVECHRDRFLENPNRLSRHWYDMAMLSQAWVGDEALKCKQILQQVINHKTAFFNAGYANYEKCLQGQLRLIPSKSSSLHLQRDYLRMQQAGLFSSAAPKFDDIIRTLKSLEDVINQ